MRLINRTRGTVVALRLRLAETFFSRLRGLLGTSLLPEEEALLIRPCNNIHMFGMRYAIDVAFASSTGQVLKTVRSLEPGRMAYCKGAAYVVEMPCDTLARTATRVSDILAIVE